MRSGKKEQNEGIQGESMSVVPCMMCLYHHRFTNEKGWPDSKCAAPTSNLKLLFCGILTIDKQLEELEAGLWQVMEDEDDQ